MLNELMVLITGDAAPLVAATDTASASLKTMGGSATTAAEETDAAGAAAAEGAGGFNLLSGSLIKSLAPLAALFAGYEGVKAIISTGKQEIDQWNSANAQLTNTLNNTHDAIGLNVEQIDKMAEATSKNTDITSAMNLTIAQQFVPLQGMTKEELPKMITLTDNVATKMALLRGQAVPSLQSVELAAKGLAKGLQDPAQGVNALARAGITLTAAQQDTIKSLDKQGQTALATQMLMTDFTDYTNGAASAALNTYQGQVENVKKTVDEFAGSLVGGGEQALQALAHAAIGLLPAIESIGRQIGQFLKPAFDDLVKAVRDNLIPTIEQNKALFEALAQGFGFVAKVILISIVVSIDLLIKYITALIDVWAWLINAGGQVVKFFFNLGVAIETAILTVQNIIQTALNWGKLLYNAGKDLVEGLVNGIKDAAGGAVHAVENLGGDVLNGLKNKLGIHSPSTVFAELGQNLGAGLVQGIQQSQDDVRAATGTLAQAAMGGMGAPGALPQGDVGLPGFAGQQSGYGNTSIYVSGNIELTTKDAVDEFFAMQGRNVELATMGITTLTPAGAH